MIPGINGPADMAEEFASKWESITREKVTADTTMKFYALSGEVYMPDAVPGSFRWALASDVGWLTDWPLTICL